MPWKLLRFTENAHQEDNLMEWIRRIRKKQKGLTEKRWFPALLFAYELMLSAASVLALMYTAVQKIAFSYEVNDDALIAQFLDGSYTGTPEAHAFYVRYPLSWLIAELYKHDSAVPEWLWPSAVPGINVEAEFGSNKAALAASATNWYVFTIALLSIFAMICVLYRIIHAFRGNLLILCALFDMAVAFLWLPVFFNLTFTTASAFMGVMGILFFGFMDEEEATRPGNLLILVVLLGSCWCLRRQCFLMVMPFIAVILVLKFGLGFFRSLRPWIAVFVICVMSLGLIHAENSAYGSESWKAYRTYNSERSWLQDYGRIPEYNGNESFYNGIGMGEEDVKAFKGYTYCMVEDFGPEKVHAICEYVSAQHPEEVMNLPGEGNVNGRIRNIYKWMRPRVGEAIPLTQEKFRNPGNISEWTKRITCILWESLIPLLLLSLVTVGEKRWKESAVLLLEILSMSLLVAAEWVYLVMNGRFPKRVEITIWLLTFCIGVLLAGRILIRWRDMRWCRLPGLVQIVLIIFFFHYIALPDALISLQAKQLAALTGQTGKAEVLEYCDKHTENRYVLRTTSFTTSTPYDDLHQGNWFMSGSWAAYSPLYEQKLAAEDTENLDIEFLSRDNVYVITQGENRKANIRRMMGRSEDEPVHAELTDTITTIDGTEYLVYKVY